MTTACRIFFLRSVHYSFQPIQSAPDTDSRRPRRCRIRTRDRCHCVTRLSSILSCQQPYSLPFFSSQSRWRPFVQLCVMLYSGRVPHLFTLACCCWWAGQVVRRAKQTVQFTPHHGPAVCLPSGWLMRAACSNRPPPPTHTMITVHWAYV
jgi:hypothetical protein